MGGDAASGHMTVHAGCILLGEDGVLIRGASGSGKSTLALALVEAATAAGLYAAHVADDRVALSRHGDRLVARPVAAIAGLMELRGLGLVPVPCAAAARLRRVVDLLETPPARLPEAGDLEAEILGVRLPRLPATREIAAATILWWARARPGCCQRTATGGR